MIDVIAILALGCATPGAANPRSDVTALEKPISVLSKPVTALKGDPRVTRTVPPPVNNAWLRIQPALARTFGVTIDPAMYEVTRIQLTNEIQYFWDPERLRLRLEELEKLPEQDARQARRLEMERREYLLYVYDGTSAIAGQAEADSKALRAAKDLRDTQLVEASNALNHALKQPGADPTALKAQYEESRLRIRQDYAQSRERILGTPQQ
jgi:hypothetical protein